jgi:hypothetical protein
MLNGLPTNTQELANFTCDDLKHQYMLLTSAKKRAWIIAAAKGGVLRLAPTSPPDYNGMIINIFDPGSGLCDGQTCSWVDTDQFNT